MTEEKTLADLKSDYEIIREKYGLANFDEMNNDFCLEKLAGVETECLIREVRKLVIDKFANYLRFVETFLQPTNAPMFVLSTIKLITNEEKKKLIEIYGELAKSEMKAVRLDLEFNEEKEAEFIRDSFGLWQKMKSDLIAFVKRLEDNWDNKPEQNGRNYFG